MREETGAIPIDLLSIAIPDTVPGADAEWRLPQSLEVCRFHTLIGELTSDALVNDRFVKLRIKTVNGDIKCISSALNPQDPSQVIMHCWGHTATDYESADATVQHHPLQNLWLFGGDIIDLGGARAGDTWSKLFLWLEVLVK